MQFTSYSRLFLPVVPTRPVPRPVLSAISLGVPCHVPVHTCLFPSCARLRSCSSSTPIPYQLYTLGPGCRSVGAGSVVSQICGTSCHVEIKLGAANKNAGSIAGAVESAACAMRFAACPRPADAVLERSVPSACRARRRRGGSRVRSSPAAGRVVCT